MFSPILLFSGFCAVKGVQGQILQKSLQNQLRKNVSDDFVEGRNYIHKVRIPEIKVVKITQVKGMGLYLQNNQICGGSSLEEETNCFFKNIPSYFYSKEKPQFYFNGNSYEIKYMYYLDMLKYVLQHNYYSILYQKFDSIIMGVYEKKFKELYAYGKYSNGKFYTSEFSDSAEELIKNIVKSNHKEWYLTGIVSAILPICEILCYASFFS